MNHKGKYSEHSLLIVSNWTMSKSWKCHPLWSKLFWNALKNCGISCSVGWVLHTRLCLPAQRRHSPLPVCLRICCVVLPSIQSAWKAVQLLTKLNLKIYIADGLVGCMGVPVLGLLCSCWWDPPPPLPHLMSQLPAPPQPPPPSAH